MKQFRQFLVFATLMIGFVAVVAQSTPAFAVKQRIYDRKILRYEEFYRQQVRFFIFQGALVTDKISDPIAQRGSFFATFLNGDFDDTNDITYLVEVKGLKAKVKLQ